MRHKGWAGGKKIFAYFSVTFRLSLAVFITYLLRMCTKIIVFTLDADSVPTPEEPKVKEEEEKEKKEEPHENAGKVLIMIKANVLQYI